MHRVWRDSFYNNLKEVDDYAIELLTVIMTILPEKTSFSLCSPFALFLVVPNINLHDTDNNNNWYWC